MGEVEPVANRNTFAATLTACEDNRVLSRPEVPSPLEVMLKVAVPILLPAVPALTPTLSLALLAPLASRVTVPVAVAEPVMDLTLASSFSE